MFLKSSEKFVIVSCLIGVLLIDSCYSSTFLTPPIVSPNYPGKCFEPTTLTALEPGQSIDIPKACIKLTCLKDFRFGGVGCVSETVLDDNCHEVDGDLSKPYPECCPRFECTNVGDNSNDIDQSRNLV